MVTLLAPKAGDIKRIPVGKDGYSKGLVDGRTVQIKQLRNKLDSLTARVSNE